MFSALARFRPRGARPLGLALPSLLAALALTPYARAQEEPAKKSDEPARKAAETPKAEPARPGYEVEAQQWAEPDRFALLENSYPELPGEFLPPRDAQSIQSMTSGGEAPNPSLIKKYVNHYVAELTKHDNIQSLLDSSSDSRGARLLQDASDALVRPLLPPATSRNARFRQMYVQELLQVAPKVLQGQLHSRTFFMTVLSRSQSPEVVPLLIEQIRSEDQAMTVKMLAAVGLNNISQNGRRPLDASSQAIPASQALAGMLRDNPEAFWPVKVRALEAMGALRHATANPLRGEPELAAVPFSLLADRGQRLDVRAWAGWALGMMDIPPQVRSFNFQLVAYAMGRAVADFGDQMLAVEMPEDRPTKNLALVVRMCDPLLRLLTGFVGDRDLPRSGLARTTHSAFDADARTMTREVEQRIRAVATSAINFSRAVGRQVPDAHKRLAADVQELRSFLAKNPPKSNELYPGGPTLELPGSAAPAAPAAGAESKKGASGGPAR
jgi:hypothetical protein